MLECLRLAGGPAGNNSLMLALRDKGGSKHSSERIYRQVEDTSFLRRRLPSRLLLQYHPWLNVRRIGTGRNLEGLQ